MFVCGLSVCGGGERQQIALQIHTARRRHWQSNDCFWVQEAVVVVVVVLLVVHVMQLQNRKALQSGNEVGSRDDKEDVSPLILPLTPFADSCLLFYGSKKLDNLRSKSGVAGPELRHNGHRIR